MKRFITFGSIDQFRTTIKNVQHTAQYVRYDEVEDIQIMDRSAKMPIVVATASEKIHGTNAAVCFSNEDDFWVQSRKNIITPEKDNAGCAFAAMQNKDYWMDIITALSFEHEIDLDKYVISVFFEWSGGNIQKKSAVSGLDKRAIIFQHFKVSPLEPVIGNDGAETPESARWLETQGEYVICEGEFGMTWVAREEVGIHNIMNAQTWNFEIDFETPLLSQNQFIELVEKVIEPNSPIGKQMGVEGNVGEGAVFTFMYKETMHRFKVKGEEHSVSKVKTLKPVDNEKEQLKIDIATKVTPGWRLEQMYAEVFDTINGGLGSVQGTGDFIKAVNKDILKEDSDIIADAGLEPKEVFAKTQQITRRWLSEQLDREASL